MPRWGGSQTRCVTFRPKVRKMSKLGDGQPNQVPNMEKPQHIAAPDQPAPNRRPAKTRMQAWAKIDGGKGTWKPK
jgi:hypothetical protein